MSRSRRKTPIVGWAVSDSDKPFKTLEHRRARRAAKLAIGDEAEPPHPKAFGDPWKSPKDGKQYLGPGGDPRWLRK